jgi:hypothetical protein
MEKNLANRMKAANREHSRMKKLRNANKRPVLPPCDDYGDKSAFHNHQIEEGDLNLKQGKKKT